MCPLHRSSVFALVVIGICTSYLGGLDAVQRAEAQSNGPAADVETATLLRTFIGHDSSVVAVMLSPDGKTLNSISADGVFKQWDVASGEGQLTLRAYTQGETIVAVSKDGKTVALASSSGFGFRRAGGSTPGIFGGGSGAVLGTAPRGIPVGAGPQGLSGVGANPFGLAGTGFGGDLRLWEVESEGQPRPLSGHTAPVIALAIAPDSKMLASGSFDHTIKLWDITNDKLLRTLAGHNGFVSAVAFSTDGKTLASGGKDPAVKLWDVATGKLKKRLEGHENPLLAVAFSPDGKTLASASEEGTIKLWDLAKGTPRWTSPPAVTSGKAYSLVFSPNGKLLAETNDSAVPIVRDAATGAAYRRLVGHKGLVRAVTFSPDSSQVVSGADDETIKLWKLDAK